MPPPDEILLSTRRFQVLRHHRVSSDGSPFTKESIQHPGAVAILPLVDSRRLCLIRNYRVAVNQTLIELPAGTLEPNEEPLATAGRELLEETGYHAGSMQPLMQMLMSPGILHERTFAFVASELSLGNRDLQPDEKIENLILTWDEALAMIADGRIVDAKTVSILLYYDRFVRQSA